MDEKARGKSYQEILVEIENVLKKYRDAGRIRTWQHAYYGFAIDQWLAIVGTTVPEQIGLAILMEVLDDGNVKLGLRRIPKPQEIPYIETREQLANIPEDSRDFVLDTKIAKPGNVREIITRMLDLVVGHPSVR